MKLYHKYSAMLTGALLLAFASCTEDVTRDLSPVQEGGGIQAYLSQDNETSLSFLPDSLPEFTVTVGRNNTAGAATVDLLVKDSKNLLDAPTSVTFADGQATAEITVDLSRMALGQSTTLEVALANTADRYYYGLASISIDVLRDYKWEDAGKVEFNDLDFGMGKLDVPIEWAQGTQLFRLPNLYHEYDESVPAGLHLQFYLDTLKVTGADGKEYRKMAPLELTKVMTLGQHNLGTGYNIYWRPDVPDYDGYFSFSNYGSSYTLNYLLVQGSSLYIGAASFVWKDGFMGEEPDPYKGEDIEAKVDTDLTGAASAGYFFGDEYFSYSAQDEYGSSVRVSVGDYVIMLEHPEIFVSLEFLAPYNDQVEIPAGEYAINNSELVSTVRVGNYAEAQDGYGSFASVPATVVTPEVNLYFASGTVKVEYSGTDATITIDAITGKGSTVKATWTGQLDIIDLTAAPGGDAGASKAGLKAHQKPQRAKLSLIK
jgi:hypothetical protein